MTERQLIPTADNIVTPVLETLYELKPKSKDFANLRNGVWWASVRRHRG